ncbi:MAG: penicillin-binding protein 1C [Bacteroidales bacterium]
MRKVPERFVWFYRWNRSAFQALLGLVCAWGLVVWINLPTPLFQQPLSYVVLDRNSDLLGATVAADGQWRFPAGARIPDKFSKALLTFEDKRFFYHPGVDPLALLRALASNLKNRRIVSGGSTITMQIVRLSRNHERTVGEKFREMLLALYLELRYSKEELLKLYAAHAPFGGNVVGLEAACWRYFGRSPDDITWAEAAMLAVLPNNPGLIHPGRNRQALLEKRNRLLHIMHERGWLDRQEMLMACEEPIPDKPRPMPSLAPHLLDRIRLSLPPDRYITTVNGRLQQASLNVLNNYIPSFLAGGIHNAAVLVLEVETGEVLVYVGNLPATDSLACHTSVDIIRSRRSPGSTLKPLLYAALLSEGKILPNTLLPDIPIQLGGFSPQNFNKTFDGAVPASAAISRSLNVPAVNMLQMFGVEKFHQFLQTLEFRSIDRPPSYYGLALILGGCEVSMWELSGAYASLVRLLNHFPQYNSRYDPADLHSPVFLKKYAGTKTDPSKLVAQFMPDAGSVWYMLKAMEEVQRPGEEAVWKQLNLREKVSWKTGTSYGFRDAWSIGMNSRYLVCVWVGNATGEGRPGLIGLQAAAPVMFDVFSLLPSAPWFIMPYDAMTRIRVCQQSGYKASSVCPDTAGMWIPKAGLQTRACPFHHIIHLDVSGRYQASAECLPAQQLQHKPWFVLPPAWEYYYRIQHSDYQPLPPVLPGCYGEERFSPMQLIYPSNEAVVYLPRLPEGLLGEMVAEVAHRRLDATIYWHLDQIYIGQTSQIHKIALRPPPGEHTLLLMDDAGNSIGCRFKVVDKTP